MDFRNQNWCFKQLEVEMVTQQSRDYEKLMPTFSNFCLANKSLRSSLTYGQCQSILLLEEIRQNKSSVRVLRKEFDNLQ